jgi:hypothetical protein
LQRDVIKSLGLSLPVARLECKQFFGACRAPAFFGQLVKSASEVVQLNAACSVVLLRNYLDTWKLYNLKKQAEALARDLSVLGENQLRRMRFRTWIRFHMMQKNQAVSELAFQSLSGEQKSLSGNTARRILGESRRGLQTMTVVKNQPTADAAPLQLDRAEISTQTNHPKRIFPITRRQQQHF